MTEPSLIAETADYFIINKPAGYSVEPHDHYPSVADWLDQSYQIREKTTAESRYGIVHRLDVETSGVLVWAKSDAVQADLQKLWQGRQVEKTYLALVIGEILPSGYIDVSLERDNRGDKQRVALLPTIKARPAITQYSRLAVGECGQEKISLVECKPITGRTHQIRVHFQYLGHPIIGDKLYGNKAESQITKRIGLERHWLHAWKISLDGQEYQAAIPPDLVAAARLCQIELPRD